MEKVQHSIIKRVAFIETRRFRNFMDYQRNWLEETRSDDWHGRALWALGTVLGCSNTPALQNMAVRIFQQSLLAILDTTSPRAWAFALIGIHEYLQRFAGDRRVSQVQEELASRLLALYQNNRTEEWNWFENKLTYCNAALSHAMLWCGESLSNPVMTEGGMEFLRWLANLQRSDTEGKHFVPIGSNGFCLPESSLHYRGETLVPGSPPRLRVVSRPQRPASPRL